MFVLLRYFVLDLFCVLHWFIWFSILVVVGLGFAFGLLVVCLDLFDLRVV